MKREVMIACDFAHHDALEAFLTRFGSERPYLKIGMELFYATGPALIHDLKMRGYPIFLDLKLHDIPNTVYKAMKSLAKLEIDLTNVHAAGGCDMMRAALDGLSDGSSASRPKLIAVTQLTSTSQQRLEEELWIHQPIASVVAHYAQNAQNAGLDGVVCSPLEVELVRQTCGDDFMTVTPGIRYQSGTDDQVRITTPEKAHHLGSHAIVVGRPITESHDPVAAYQNIVAEFTQGVAK